MRVIGRVKMNIWQTDVRYDGGKLWQCVTSGQKTRGEANAAALNAFAKEYPNAKVESVDAGGSTLG
jgi:hypothetical protein